MKNTLNKIINSILLLSVVSIISCSENYVDDEFIESTINIDSQSIDSSNPASRMMPPDLGNVFVAIVPEKSCGVSRFIYSIHASSSKAYPYDRQIQAAVVKKNALIEGKLLTIPAGQHVSNNVPIFRRATQSFGKVTSRAYNVLANGQFVEGYSFPSINHNVTNCYTVSPSGGSCYGIYAADDPSTTANEGPGDQDHDGVCNSSDTDDNGNNIPDDWED